MTPPDDISFDFFDDDVGLPEPARRGRGRSFQAPRGRRPTPPPPAAPMLRLLTLVLCVIFLLLVFSLLVSSCAAPSAHSADASYMNAVSAIASQSTRDGTSTVGILTTPGLSVSTLVSKLEGIASSEKQALADASALSPPGHLRSENAGLVEALQLRVLGVAGIIRALPGIVNPKVSDAEEALVLSGKAYVLLASDVVWEDLFRVPATNELDSQGVGGVNVPSSSFLADPNLIVTPDAMSLVVSRIASQAGSNGTSCPGVHGTSLVSVEALPTGVSGKPETLNSGPLNVVTTGTNIAFRVTVEDVGDFQEVHIPVQLTIARAEAQGGPITKTAQVQLVDPGQDASVVFTSIGELPFGAVSPTTLSVNVAPVCGETNTSDNSASYKVTFTLPG